MCGCHSFDARSASRLKRGDSPLGPIVAYQEPRHWSQFQTVDPEYGIQLTGVADAIFEYADGSYLIADYKTARFTAVQNKKLMPRYKVQPMSEIAVAILGDN